MNLYDAHNHLQDERLQPRLNEVWADLYCEPIVRMVVNGCRESDWPAVLKLARENPRVLPSFGYHPWYVKERTARWKENLLAHLNQVPAAVGEIGLDRWIKNFDVAQQEEVFVWQLRLAAERNLPVSIHCLQAWGALLQILEREARPACGFLLHSYGGSEEMIAPLAKLGAYFSFPGYFAYERKARQRQTFQQVPIERLLIETDAPDQLPPPDWVRYPLKDAKGNPINHPANLRAIYEFTAQLLEKPLEELASQVEQNFQRLFRSKL